MSPSDLERRVTTTLRQHAEDAMNNTKSDMATLDRLVGGAEQEGLRRRRAVVAGALVAAAAVVAVVLWASGLTPGESTVSPPAGRPSPEQVATDFVGAYASYDRPRLKSLLAGQALRDWDDLRHNNIGDEAIEFRVLLDSCTTVVVGDQNTRVQCPFDAHALGSEQLGRGPWSDNAFELTVRDGKIIYVGPQFFNYAHNDFALEMWEPFERWVTNRFPEDAADMFDESTDPRPEATSAELFHRHIADYQAAMSPP